MKSTLLSFLIGGALLAQPAAVAPAKTPVPTPSWKTLKFPTLREVKIPDIAPIALPNGMRVFLLANHELPVVSGFALIRTGNLFDPKDKIGVADITGEVMRTGGTQDKTGEQLNEQLENIAASVEASIGETSGNVSFNALKENTGEVLSAFKAVLTTPEFRQDKIDLAKTHQKSAISRRNDDPGDIVRREFGDIVYGQDTPYGWRAEYETIDRITRDDLLAFHKRYYFPKNTILAVYGDFNESEMRAKIEKLFADWIAEQPPVPDFPKVSLTPHPGLHFAAKNDVNQTAIRIGHLGGMLRDKDYPALEVMGSVLGGSPFTSRLGNVIRVQKGYAYQVGAYWSATYDHPGTFQIIVGTKSENTVDAIKTIQSEVEKFRSAPPTAQELKSAKDKILNTFVFNFDSPSKTLNRLINYEYYGYPKDFIFQYQKAIEAVTPADVQRVAKEYLKPENFTYVVVGKQSDIKPPLTALNMPVGNIDLTIPEPKREAAKADTASLAKGAELLKKMTDALGGADKLAALRDCTVASDLELQAGPAGGIKAKQTVSFIAPSIYRQENELPFGKIISFYDGQGGWLKSPQGEMPLGGPVLKQMQDQFFRNMHNLARNASSLKANYTGEGTLEISNASGQTTRLVLDEATGLPKKQIYQGAGMGGAPQEVEEQYHEFSDAGGIKFASRVTILQGGKKFADAKVTSLNVNIGLKPEDLAKKP